MALDLKKTDLFSKNNMFKISPEDNQILIFSGNRQIPDDPPTETPIEWDFIENFDAINTTYWTSELLGVTSTAAVAGSILTLTSGSTDDNFAKLALSIPWGPINTTGNFKIEIKMRSNYSAASKMETSIGMTATPAADWPADESNTIILGYNMFESGNNMFLQTVKAGAGGGDSDTYNNNTWETWTLNCKVIDGATATSDQAGSLISIFGNTPDTSTLYFILFIATRGNPGVTQTLEVDYVKIKYGIE